MKSETISDLAAALAKAQAQISDAEKTRKNPHLKNSYATLASVWDACRVQLSSNGLSVVQGPDGDVLVTTLAHASGQWVETRTPILYASQRGLSDAQAYGAALTYARRYALAAIVGVAQEDDDGNAAGRRERPREEPRPSEPAQQEHAPPTPARADERDLSAPASGLALEYIEAIHAEAAKYDTGAITGAEVEAYLAALRKRVGERLRKDEMEPVIQAHNALLNHVRGKAAAK
jgi:hypothetical protein